MKATKLTLFVLMLSGVAIFARENATFTHWMRSTGTAWRTLNKMEKKTGPEAVRSAETLGGVYENMIGYWRQRDPETAKLAEEGKAAAVILASAAYAGDSEKADAEFKTLSGTCQSCHTAHRVKLPNGAYAIKIK